MDTQQEINLALLEGIREMGVQFAFPTRSVEFIGGSLPEITVAGVAQEKPAANQNEGDAGRQPREAQPRA
jgi:small-conductance mechanosensitive channel